MTPTIVKKPEKFNKAKDKIKTAVLNIPSDISLKPFKTKGNILFFTNHNVTGKELNDLLVSPIEDTLIKQNEHLKNLFKYMHDSYELIESLDKEYMAGIIKAIESAECTSQDAKYAAYMAMEARKKSDQVIEEHEKTIRILSKIVEKINDQLVSRSLANIKKQSIDDQVVVDTFIEHSQQITNQLISDIVSLQQCCEKFKSIEHLQEVDTIWNDVNSLQQYCEKLQSLEHLQEVDTIWNDVNSLQQYCEKLQSLEHLQEVDTIWNNVEGNNAHLHGLQVQLEAFITQDNQSKKNIIEDINSLKRYRTELKSLEHLHEIDSIWSDVKGNKTDLSELQILLDNFIAEVYSTQKKITKSINRIEEENKLVRKDFCKKIKIAYIVGGCALGLTIVNYILQFANVL